MRITEQGTYQRTIQQLQQRLSAYSVSQNRVSSGKAINRPSDDPLGMSKALELRAAKKARQQETRNAEDGVRWLNLADTALQSVVDRLQRVRELAVRGATFTSVDERSAIAAEVDALKEDLVDLANSRYQGRPLFSGFSAADPVQLSGAAWTYAGDNGAINRRVGENEVVQVNLTADDVFGFTSAKDLFTTIDDFVTALNASSQAGIDTAITEIDTAMDTVLTSLSQLGAATNRVENAKAKSADDLLTIRTSLTEIEDVDLSEAILDLQLQETAYQGTLAAFARSSQPSLVDFLR
jgi:flagellar hook-associated protein 3 FlgL